MDIVRTIEELRGLLAEMGGPWDQGPPTPPVRAGGRLAGGRLAPGFDPCRPATAPSAGTATIGFVPTMGALHEGHLSLFRRARAECNVTVASLFVNPTQFGPGEDFARYPRAEARDAARAAGAGVDLLFAPAVEELYPPGAQTLVRVEALSRPLCGRARPGHFDGVATVVALLFGAVGACRAYFGQKDAQQVAVIRRMVRDLRLPVAVIVCPIVRAPDGLALSSRNVYLTPAERAQAPVLHRALQAGVRALVAGERDPARLRAVMEREVATAPLARIDYLEVVEGETLATPARVAGPVLLAGAVWFDRTRLIDNVCADPARGEMPYGA